MSCLSSLISTVAVAASALAGQAQTPAVPQPTQANVAYGKHEKQVLDFYQAASDKPVPLLFFIHGGGWMNGDKANPDFLAKCLESGISVVSINYRLIPDVSADKSVPPVKACLDDSARALQFVRSKAAEWKIDKTRIGGCGGSAGGFNSLWLAFHPDMADAKSADPMARESTRLTCVLGFVPQTSLDPQQMRDWISNNDYGHHAFLLASYQEFVDKRESLMPWIERFSPYALATSDDPPVYLFYDSVPAMGKEAKDPPHSANFGVGLEEKLKKVGIPYELNYTGGPQVKHPDIFGFLLEHLKGPKAP
ncbi:MAG: alpha/beta hydrolase [Verrucomicrobiota bacterium]